MHREINICVNACEVYGKNKHTIKRCYYRYLNTVGPKSQNYYAPQNKNNSNLN